ncbi:acyltransferase family protein [Sphingobacterium yanglingense]|uniref:Putative acyltransferase n=1 Tax=Sphingobacterium yanglingense TaxID=1437280 RepID=A0A4R6W4E6_9SPHI|nr:DUF5009 domain-containing protein [Sphingobacterium yanglingense]TDQ73458.1 putative acyltransferase [Sphingobacterium yanglingense]
MEPTPQKSKRLTSLDALRGFDMFFIMGLAGIIVALTELFPDSTTMQWLGSQMHHVEWHGLTHHDTIFPLFLFIAGISFPFSLHAQRRSGKSESEIYRKIIKRGITLVLLGIVYNGFFQLDFENLRYASVLGRIGLAWMFSALLFVRFGTRTNLAIAVVLLVGYWLALWLIPDASDPYSFEDNLVGTVDRLLLPGKLIYGSFDPEGLLSTIPAIAMAMFGMFTGQWIQLPSERYSDSKKISYMLVTAVLLILIGYIWSLQFPINKKLWTSSFVCVVSGISLILFSLFYYLMDVKGYTRYALFFSVVGLNSITIYLAQEMVSFSKISNYFLGGLIEHLPEGYGELLSNIGYFAVCWLFLYFLYKKKIFLKV